MQGPFETPSDPPLHSAELRRRGLNIRFPAATATVGGLVAAAARRERAFSAVLREVGDAARVACAWPSGPRRRLSLSAHQGTPRAPEEPLEGRRP